MVADWDWELLVGQAVGLGLDLGWGRVWDLVLDLGWGRVWDLVLGLVVAVVQVAAVDWGQAELAQSVDPVEGWGMATGMGLG